MANIQALIEFMADGHFYSSEQINTELSLSRAEIWQKMQKLEDYGLKFEFVEGSGYRLLQSLRLLKSDEIIQNIDAEIASYLNGVDVFFELDSTNAWTMEKLKNGEVGKGYICLAEFQYRGRGRRGRQWLSPLGSSITLSLAWEFEGGAVALEGLSLAIAVAVARTLVRLGLPSVQLKWPNDILLNHTKLGGILLEVSKDPADLFQVVIGIGLNVSMKPEIFDIGQPWTSLGKHLPGISRSELLSILLSELLPLLRNYAQTGFSVLVEEWNQYDAYRGQVVNVISGKYCYQGEVIGVADDGALVLDIEGNRQSFHGGEVSVRLQHDS